MTFDSGTSGFPPVRFSRTVPVKQGSPPPTYTVSARRLSSVTQAMSSPSYFTRPRCGSRNRGGRLARALASSPSGAATAVTDPAGNVRESPSSSLRPRGVA